MTKNIFKVICKKCHGLCCKATVVVTKKDLDKLNTKYKGMFKIIKEETGLEKTPGHFILTKNHLCPFLGKTGCVLEENEKPFDCIFFPLAFIYKNNTTSFYINKHCPFCMKIPKKELLKTKRWGKERLKSWTDEEKLFYSKDVENYPKSLLIPL